jgi:hypothetical protein
MRKPYCNFRLRQADYDFRPQTGAIYSDALGNGFGQVIRANANANANANRRARAGNTCATTPR